MEILIHEPSGLSLSAPWPKIMLHADLGMDEDDEEAVPLPNVNAAILRKVIQWCTYHKDDPPPPEDDENKEKRTDDISSWDTEFLKVDQGTLFELILVRTLSLSALQVFQSSSLLHRSLCRLRTI